MTQVASGSPLHSAPPNACRAPPHDSTPTASFDVCLLDLLWPQPPLTSSLHQGSTLGPLISVVAACVKDARPSRWLAPLERPRWPQHRPRVAPPAKPSLSADPGRARGSPGGAWGRGSALGARTGPSSSQADGRPPVKRAWMSPRPAREVPLWHARARRHLRLFCSFFLRVPAALVPPASSRLHGARGCV